MSIKNINEQPAASIGVASSDLLAAHIRIQRNRSEDWKRRAEKCKRDRDETGYHYALGCSHGFSVAATDIELLIAANDKLTP